MDFYVRGQLVSHLQFLGRQIEDMESLEQAQAKQLDDMRKRIAETKANAASVEAALAQA